MRTINRWAFFKNKKGTGGSIFDPGDACFWIPVQQMYVGDGTTSDLMGNVTITAYRTVLGDGHREFKIAYDSNLDAVNLILDEVFWDDATKTPKWIDHTSLGANYTGNNYLFQNIKNSPFRDLILFTTQRTSSTSPSIEKVCWYLQLTPGEVFTFDGEVFTFGGKVIRF